MTNRVHGTCNGCGAAITRRLTAAEGHDPLLLHACKACGTSCTVAWADPPPAPANTTTFSTSVSPRPVTIVKPVDLPWDDLCPLHNEPPILGSILFTPGCAACERAWVIWERIRQLGFIP